ncbi:MAG: hypothetical protein HY824_14945 [Acidobacteria bacterium]|nr:hypothetical protein [Acidobacteriota bacterium]
MVKGLLSAVVIALAVPAGLQAQGRGGAAPTGPMPPARTIAPKDVTGYFVSVVAEHWHLRMLVPPKGEFAMLPLNAEARKTAMAWDPAKDQAEGNACKSYGAAAIMRVPGRLNLHWADDNTLQMDIDSGTQTRQFHFAPPQGQGAAQPPQWQGYSVAEWDGVPAQELRARKAGSPPDLRGGLRVTTTRMRAGYLRKNGVPYSENATLTEYFDRFTEPNGDDWLVVDSIVRDPQYLTQPYLTSSAFRKIPDRSGWDPTPCRANEAR